MISKETLIPEAHIRKIPMTSRMKFIIMSNPVKGTKTHDVKSSATKRPKTKNACFRWLYEPFCLSKKYEPVSKLTKNKISLKINFS